MLKYCIIPSFKTYVCLYYHHSHHETKSLRIENRQVLDGKHELYKILIFLKVQILSLVINTRSFPRRSMLIFLKKMSCQIPSLNNQNLSVVVSNKNGKKKGILFISQPKHTHMFFLKTTISFDM